MAGVEWIATGGWECDGVVGRWHQKGDKEGMDVVFTLSDEFGKTCMHVKQKFLEAACLWSKDKKFNLLFS